MLMKKYYLKITTALFALICFVPAWAQISEGGLPPSFGMNQLKRSIQPYEIPVDFDVNKLLEEDEEERGWGLPPRCAKIIPAGLSIENSGEWIRLPTGQRIWNLEIYAPNALAIMLYYEQFILPEGSQLFLYNPDHSKVLGAYTQKTNSKKANFATEFVYGDRIILEYVEPPFPTDETGLPQIKISGIAYGYNHFKIPASEGLEKIRVVSGDCMVNVNCPEGAGWQDQKKGVARIITPVGGGYVAMCSGTLINNTAGDFDPLFLSAYHCFEGLTAEMLNQTVYYFNYEYPDCTVLGTDPDCPTMVGAQLLVDLDINGASDGALLRLNDSVPEDYDVYFNGWDRRNIAAASGVGIHHPKGDVKKISTFTAPATSVTWTGDVFGANNAHWNVFFSPTENGHGVVEGGSSGSPLFNQNKLVVGTLTGGNSSCDYRDGVNLYGKLWYHWEQGIAKMSAYLDPAGLGAETIEGAYPNYGLVQANFSVSPDEIYATQPVHFINKSRNATTWEWSFEGGSPAFSNEQNPPPITFNEPGTYKAVLIVDKGMETEKEKSMDVVVTIKEYICPSEHTIGNGNSYTQFPLGALQRQTFSSALYTAEEIGLEKEGWITQISWNAQAACSVARSLSIYLKETEDDILTATTWENEINGATLVYTSANSWTNSSDWVTVTLPKAFLYSGGKNLKVMVRAYAQSDWDNANSNCYYTPSTNRHLRWTSGGGDVPGGNGIRDNRRPDVRLNVDVPCGVFEPVADFLTGTFPVEEPAEFPVEEVIPFTDLSTGPVVNREWSFPGGVPETSTEENPSVTYNEKGIYTVTLKVSNHLGSDTQQRTITIKGKPPVADFSSSSAGFTTYPDHGQFLPYPGGAVSFTDQSAYNPAEWTWKLYGIEPEIMEGQTVTVNYPAGEKTYDVGYLVSNEEGSDTKLIEKYVKVGGTSPVWNIPQGDEGNTYYQISEDAYLTGTNSNYAIIAEKFTSPAAGSVSGVALMMKVINSTGVSVRTYTVSIYDEKDGKPGDVLSSGTFKGSSINPSGYTTVVFPQPASVSGNFYIEIKGMGTALNTRVAVASSQASAPTVYVYKNYVWIPLEEIDSEKRKISLNVVPTFTYDYLPIELTRSIIKKKNIDTQKEVVEVVSDEKDWSVTAGQEWIKIEKEASNPAAFTILCEENLYGWRKGTVTVTAGISRGVLTVQQAGINPSALKAEYNEENDYVIVSWEHSAASAEPVVYRVYRDEQFVDTADVGFLYYKDADYPEGQEICYTVSAVYNSDEELESTLSEPACIRVKTGIKDIQPEKSRIELYPNPADNYLTVRSQSVIEKITVQDVQGRQVQWVYPVDKTEMTIQTSGWEKGVYIVKVQTQKDSSNYKVVKK
jgi:PKD repeat protein